MFREYLETVFWERFREIGAIFWAFLRLATRTFSSISDHGSRRPRWELSLLLFFCVVAAQFVGAWLINDVSPTTAPSFIRTSFLTVLVLAIGFSPFLMAFSFFKQRDSLFGLNVILVQQFFVAIIWLISTAIYDVPQPARGDFARFERGTGYGTVVYRTTCGKLDDSLALTKLTRWSMAGARAAQAPWRTVATWNLPTDDSPETTAIWFGNLSDAQQEFWVAQFERVSRELPLIEENIKRHIYLADHEAELQQEFDATYPNVAISRLFSVIALGAISLLSGIHLIRGLFIQRLSRGMWWAMVFVAVVAWSASGFLNFTLSKAFYHDTPILPGPPDLPKMSLAHLREQLPKIDADMAAASREMDYADGLMRELYEDEKKLCPDVTDHGLWSGASK